MFAHLLNIFNTPHTGCPSGQASTTLIPTLNTTRTLAVPGEIILKKKKNSKVSTKTKKPKEKKPSQIVQIPILGRILDQTIFRRIIGIDMSLSSPGLTVVHPLTKTMNMYFFRSRRCERSAYFVVEDAESVFFGWQFCITCIENTPSEIQESYGKNELYNRYLSKLLKLMAILGSCEDEWTVCGIEHYAFSKNTSSASTLMELGGVIRTLLSIQNYNVVELAPTAVKKMFSGNGKANKEIMNQIFIEKYKIPKIDLMIGLKDSKTVSHPTEDLVDSFAVAISCIYLPPINNTINEKTVSAKRKRTKQTGPTVSKNKKMKDFDVASSLVPPPHLVPCPVSDSFQLP